MLQIMKEIMNELSGTINSKCGPSFQSTTAYPYGPDSSVGALFLLVFGRARGMDDAGVHTCASRDLQAVFLEILIHPMKQLVAQIVILYT